MQYDRGCLCICILHCNILMAEDITDPIGLQLIENPSLGGGSMEDSIVISFLDIVKAVEPLREKYKIDAVYIFGSYARNEATAESDVDFLVCGGDEFRLVNIFAFAEELRKMLGKPIDAFEINEINEDSDFYRTIMKERRLVA